MRSGSRKLVFNVESWVHDVDNEASSGGTLEFAPIAWVESLLREASIPYEFRAVLE